MNKFDLLKNNLFKNDVRDAEEVERFSEATFSEIDLCRERCESVLEGKYSETSFEVLEKLWFWTSIVPRHADVVRFTEFTHFKKENVRSIRMTINSVECAFAITFGSVDQLLEFYIPTGAMYLSDLKIEISSTAPPISGGVCKYESYFGTSELRKKLHGFQQEEASPRFWPVFGKKLICTLRCFAYDVPEVI